MPSRSKQPTEDELTAVAELRAALSRFNAATDAITARHGLTPRRYDLLAQLHAAADGGRRAGVLADRLCLSRNATTELVTRAEKAGLVVRTADPRDGRSKLVRPTEEGSRRFLAALAELVPERRRLLEILGEVAAHTGRLASEPDRPSGPTTRS